MAEWISPQGEVLDIPAGGAHALRALGWEPVEKQEPKAEAPKKAAKGRPKSKG